MVRIVRGLCLAACGFALLFVWGQASAPAVPKREIVLPKKGPPVVDVMIVLDITGSMDWAIKSIDQEVQLLADHIKNSKMDVQLGLTVFRDELMRSPDDARAGITDDPFTFRFKGRPYTSDGAEIKKVLALLKANGGGDGPENSFEGLRLAADAGNRPGAVKVQILITDAEPKPWPMYEENLGKTQNYLLAKKTTELYLITTAEHRPIYQKLWGKSGGLELRGEWHDIRGLATKPGVFRSMLQSLETRVFTAIADSEKKEDAGK